MDPSQVIHVGSFSKTLAPSLRLGYVVADSEVMSRLVGLKRETDSGTGALDQMVVAEYFSQNFSEHVGGLSGVLNEKLDTMVEALEREFGTAVEKMWRPKGGIFLWIKLPDSIDVTKLVAPAAKAGLVFNPGPEWSCNPAETKSHMRLCFALPSKDEIRNGVAALARVCYEKPASPSKAPISAAPPLPAIAPTDRWIERAAGSLARARSYRIAGSVGPAIRGVSVQGQAGHVGGRVETDADEITEQLGQDAAVSLGERRL